MKVARKLYFNMQDNLYLRCNIAISFMESICIRRYFRNKIQKVKESVFCIILFLIRFIWKLIHTHTGTREKANRTTNCYHATQRAWATHASTCRCHEKDKKHVHSYLAMRSCRYNWNTSNVSLWRKPYTATGNTSKFKKTVEKTTKRPAHLSWYVKRSSWMIRVARCSLRW